MNNQSMKVTLKEKLKYSPSFWVFLWVVLIVVLTYGELIDKPNFTLFHQCSSYEAFQTNGGNTSNSDSLAPRSVPKGHKKAEINTDKSIWCPLVKNVSSNLLEALYHAISFAVLVLVFGIFYMRDIQETIKKGFEDIGETIANRTQPVTDSAIRSLEKLAKAADIHNEVYSSIDVNNLLPIPANIASPVADPGTEKLIEDKEREVLAFINQGELKKAEIAWLNLMKQKPQNISVFERMSLFYKEHYKDFSSERVLKIILPFKNTLEKEPMFYKILADIYMRLGDASQKEDAKKNAINAAKKSIELEPDNPRWQGLLGYVNFWFGDMKQGILHTEKALKKAENQKNESLTMSFRNNLACYYASEMIHEDKAKNYSKTVYEYYKLQGVKTETEKEAMEKMAMGFDSMGYVILRFATTKEEIEKSISYFTNALKFFPKRRVIMEHLQEACIKIRNFNE